MDDDDTERPPRITLWQNLHASWQYSRELNSKNRIRTVGDAIRTTILFGPVMQLGAILVITFTNRAPTWQEIATRLVGGTVVMAIVSFGIQGLRRFFFGK